MKKMIMASALALAASSANAISIKAIAEEYTIAGIQEIKVTITDEENQNAFLRVKGIKDHVVPEYFKTFDMIDITNFEVDQRRQFTLYFKVPAKGTFEYDLCAVTQPRYLDDFTSYKIMTCDTIKVTNN